jgi:phage portal protein BeeE
MEKTVGIIKHYLYGESAVEALRRTYKQTKEVQTFTNESLHSMVFKGDSIPHIEYGKLFRVAADSHAHVLGISTRYGPIMLRAANKNTVEVLMNATLQPWLTEKKKNLDLGAAGRFGPVMQFIGYKDSEFIFLNIGEMVEQSLA